MASTVLIADKLSCSTRGQRLLCPLWRFLHLRQRGRVAIASVFTPAIDASRCRPDRVSD